MKFTSRNSLKYITKLIRYKSRGNNPVKPFKLCTGYFWLILKLSYTNDVGNLPGGEWLCGVDKMSRQQIARLVLSGHCVV